MKVTTNIILPILFIVFTILAIVVLIYGFLDLRAINNQLDMAVHNAILPDTLIFDNEIYSDTFSVSKIHKLNNLTEIRMLSNSTLDNNTITFLFTFFSVALLSAGVYILNSILKLTKEFQVEHNIIKEDNLNSRYTLSLLFNVDYLYNLVVVSKDFDDRTALPNIRQVIKDIKTICRNKNLTSFEDRVKNTLSTKLVKINTSLVKLKDNEFANNPSKLQEVDKFLANLAIVSGIVRTKEIQKTTQNLV